MNLQEFFSDSRKALFNARNNEVIKTALAEYGITEEKLNLGIAKYEEAVGLDAAQKKEYGEQFEATDELNRSYNTANKMYVRHVKLARLAMDDNRGMQEKLDIIGQRKKTLSGWLHQAKRFYTNALNSEDVLTALAEYNITAEKLQEGQQLVAAVETASNKQFKEKGEAQNATKSRDAAVDDLQNFMGNFIAVARIALEDRPQILEALGIVVPS